MKYYLDIISKNEDNIITDALINPISYIELNGMNISNPTDEYLEVNNIGKSLIIEEEQL